MRSKLGWKRKCMPSSPTHQHDEFNDTGGLTELGNWLVGRDERNGGVKVMVAQRT